MKQDSSYMDKTLMNYSELLCADPAPIPRVPIKRPWHD